jgi:hypothetical protein
VAFIVNGAEWNFNGIASADAQERIERALEFIETSVERCEVVAVGEDFQTRPMHGLRVSGSYSTRVLRSPYRQSYRANSKPG